MSPRYEGKPSALLDRARLATSKVRPSAGRSISTTSGPCSAPGPRQPSAAQAGPGRRPAARPLLMALACGFGRRGAQAVEDPAEQKGQEAHGQQWDARHDLEVER